MATSNPHAGRSLHESRTPRTIIGGGLLCDTRAPAVRMLQVEIGITQIKVEASAPSGAGAAGGVVADYVPFYFAPRSPMLYVIERGSVPTYDQGCDGIIYLVTTTQRLVEHRLGVAVSDRNAVLAHASRSIKVQWRSDRLGTRWRQHLLEQHAGGAGSQGTPHGRMLGARRGSLERVHRGRGAEHLDGR